jgi:ribosomal protein S8
MQDIINAINNSFRYRKASFEIKKNKKTILFLKCLVESNIIRYFRDVVDNKTGKKVIFVSVNTLNYFDIKLISKSGRKIYVRGNPSFKKDVNCYFVFGRSPDRYIDSFKSQNGMSGELIAKIFI